MRNHEGAKKAASQEAVAEENNQSLAVRQESEQDEAGVSSIMQSPSNMGSMERTVLRIPGLLLQRRRLGRRLCLPHHAPRKRSKGLHPTESPSEQRRP
jgi:hypothetical protein